MATGNIEVASCLLLAAALPLGKRGSELQVPDGVSCLEKEGEVNQRKKEQASMALAGVGHPELAHVLGLGCRAGHTTVDSAEGVPHCPEHFSLVSGSLWQSHRCSQPCLSVRIAHLGPVDRVSGSSIFKKGFLGDSDRLGELEPCDRKTVARKAVTLDKQKSRARTKAMRVMRLASYI